MSGQYPTTPVFESVNFTSKFYNLSSTSLSGRTQVRNIGGQRWEFAAKYSRLTRTEFAPIMAFIMLQKGSNDTFTIVLPQISSKSGAVTGTVQANITSTEQIGATSIIVDGITGGAFKAGDVFKFANHTKVYMITEDLSANGTLKFQPPLVFNVPNNTSVTKDNIPFTVRLNNDVQTYDLGSASLLDFEIDFIEAI
jgi:hypothetical protein